MENKIVTLGIDIGSSNIKLVLMEYSENPIILDKKVEKIRKRNSAEVSYQLINDILEKNNLKYEDLAYLASTGEGEMLLRKKGHFYSMTTHAKGGAFLYPGSLTVVDMGSLYVRAITINELGRVLNYKMTGQCASGSGQFVENISRYLGLAIEEVGDISLKATKPETPSGICAVLAETDVINMVSRGITTPNIIKGIHLSIANKIIKLLTSVKAKSPVILTGGMAMNHGMVQAIEELIEESKLDLKVHAHPDSIFAGAIGAAIWGGFRYYKLNN
ncbi:MAG TPA: benzoyl-CoA reductase subunit D [Ignavibacteria bacterium]|nr:benzoyl-CoA reductase subunit D [Ignavibacteria bacterium]